MRESAEVYAGQRSHNGPRNRAIVGIVASYLLSYLMLGLFQLLEYLYADQALVDPVSGAIFRPYEGPYITVVTLSLYVPLVFAGMVLGWIVGDRPLVPALVVAVLYVLTGLMGITMSDPGMILLGWDVPPERSSPLERTAFPLKETVYGGYLIALSVASILPATYLASRIRNRGRTRLPH